MSRIKLLVTAALVLGLATVAAADVVLIGGRAMVPLRSFRDHFGAAISYDSRSGISISLDYHTARMRPGYRQYWVDDRAYTLNADIVIINGVTYVPVGFMNDAFGYDCRWDAPARQVIIVQPRTHKRVVLDCDRDGRRYERRYEPRRDDRDWDRDRNDYRRDDRNDRSDRDNRYDRDDRNGRYDRDERNSRYDRDERDRKCDDNDRGKGKSKGKGHGKSKGKGHSKHGR
ncbi:MAG: copper amine oxidase N-terminal domain-containing protein [Armatimonadota bacterium]